MRLVKLTESVNNGIIPVTYNDLLRKRAIDMFIDDEIGVVVATARNNVGTDVKEVRFAKNLISSGYGAIIAYKRFGLTSSSYVAIRLGNSEYYLSSDRSSFEKCFNKVVRFVIPEIDISDKGSFVSSVKSALKAAILKFGFKEN